MRSNYKPIEDLVIRVDERNTDGSVDTLVGVSIDKCFIKSVANTVGTDLTKYKIIRKKDFAVSLMQVSRDQKIPVAMQMEYDVAIMSPAYPIFRVKDESVILPEYLEMWFKRPEFDREASFIAVGGVRGSMPWEEFSRMKLPVPAIEEQKEIVKNYKAISERIELKKKINDNLESSVQALFNHTFAPYYSGNESLPSSWHTCVLSDVCHIKGGKRLPADCEFSEGCTNHPYIRIRDMYQGKYIELSNDFEYIDEPVFLQVSRYTVSAGDIIIAIVGITSGEVAIIGDTLEGANLTENCVKLTNFQKVTSEYIYCYWQYLRNNGGIDPLLVGAAQPKLPMYNIQSVPILIPDQDTMQLFEKRSATISARVGANLNEIHKLQELQNLMVSRLSSC